MHCPNCGHTYSYGKTCPDCGVDPYIFEKMQRASLQLYRRGFAQAEEEDLSGAVVSLSQSLLMDKNNIMARNLLGLVLCETGQIAEAIKHWIISSSLQAEKNPARRYINVLQKNAREMEKAGDSIVAYNQALVYLKQSSEDLAVIQLKRAVDCNGRFLEAQNLLACCLMAQGKPDQAASYVQRVLARDRKNPTSLRYAKLLGMLPEAKGTKAEKQRAKKMAEVASFRKPEKKRASAGAKAAISFVAGIVCTAAVLLVLALPALADAKDAKIRQLEADLAKAQQTEVLSPEEISKLKQELEEAKNQNEVYEKQVASQENQTRLNDAADLQKDGSFTEAAEILLTIDATYLTPEELTLYTTAKEEIYPEAAETYYNQGRRAYQNQNMPEAKTALENALKLVTDASFSDDALYYLGKIAEDDADLAAAKGYYERILQEFPESNQRANAQNSLDQLSEPD